MIIVEQANNTASRKLFIKVATDLYAKNTPWIRPLNITIDAAIDFQNNPFYKNGLGCAFIAKIKDQYIGRILVHISKFHQLLHQENVCYFGLFECIDNHEAAKALLNAAENFAKQHNCKILRGPFNITAAQEIGMVVEGFDQAPSSDMVYTKEYYPSLLKKNGYKKCLAMQTWRNEDIKKLSYNKIPKTSLSNQRITFRNLNFWRRSRDLELIRELINSAFVGNWGFIPINREEWQSQIEALIPFLDPKLIIIAEIHGIPIGVTFAIPDYNKTLKHTNGRIFHPAILSLLKPNLLKSAVVILFAVRKQFQNMKISRTLNSYLINNLQKKGYEKLSITWIENNNIASKNQAISLKMNCLHKLAMFEKIL